MLLLILSACSNTKYLEKGELLYESTNITVESSSPKNKIKNKSDLTADLTKLAVPKANKRILNLFAVRLWAYNKSLNATKGLKKWVNESYGEPPVLFGDENIDITIERMKNFLFQNGYFTSNIEATKDIYNKKISVDYTVKLNRQYQFGEIYFPKENIGIYKVIEFYKNESKLKKDAPFSTEELNNERERIAADAKNSGFYRFNKDLIRFELDTNATKNKVEVVLKIKEENNEAILRKSYIKTVQLYSDYNPNLNSPVFNKSTGCEFQMPDTSIINYKRLRNQTHYVFKEDIININVLKKAILFKIGLPYSSKDYNNTINNLINLGIYKFVDIQLNPCQRENYDSLNVTILLTTRNKIEFEADVEVNSKTDSSDPLFGLGNLGTAVSVSNSNLNSFGGAERFKTGIFGGIEFQPFAGKDSLINAFELSIQANLSIPRFVVPFETSPNLGRIAPKTLVGLGVQYLNRTRFFESVNFNASFGYQWQNNQTIQHRFNLLNVNFFRLLSEEPEFTATLENNSLLKSSFTNQLLFGTQYNFVYNKLFNTNKEEYTYLKTQVEVVGNLINRFLSPNENNEKLLLGVKTAQFIKLDVEGKYYRIFSDKHLLANRVSFGIGVPYGNSTTLPYSKQYFIGGANSLRAFRIRSLGPGSFTPDEDQLFPDQTGEFKIELNTEYRFDIAKYLEGAFFVDAGNIWNLNLKRLEDTPEKYFEFKDLYKELALGAGVGLRLDFSYFIIRADVALPLRRQWNNENFQWINSNRFQQITNSEKYIFNLAIGYPF